MIEKHLFTILIAIVGFGYLNLIKNKVDKWIFISGYLFAAGIIVFEFYCFFRWLFYVIF